MKLSLREQTAWSKAVAADWSSLRSLAILSPSYMEIVMSS